MIAFEFFNSGTVAIISTLSFVRVTFCTGERTFILYFHTLGSPLITVIGSLHRGVSLGSLKSITSIKNCPSFLISSHFSKVVDHKSVFENVYNHCFGTVYSLGFN
jgi:hypothetical protein